PLQPAGLAERSRQRARLVRHLGESLSRGECRPGRQLAAHDARHVDPRQQALGRRARPHRRALRNARCLAAAVAPLAADEPTPSRNDEYLLYQTLLGSFREEGDDGDPARGLAAYAERIECYMLKAARESRARTSWISPDPAYESALAGFVRGVLAPSASNPFL